MRLPAAIFVGFFPKATQHATDWLGNKQVKSICSVSTCISDGPQDWIAQWKHNELGFYDSEELALQVGARSPESLDVYAYKLLPLRCIDDQIETVTIAAKPGDVPDDYEFLGYDIVTKSMADFFECSPLSCNGAAAHCEVNEHCLIDDRDMAFTTLKQVSKAGTYEPGPYYLFEVYRKRKRT